MYLIHRATIINDGRSFTGSVLTDGSSIADVYEDEVPKAILERANVIDARGLWLLPGIIDSHVHFRQPGLTHKGDIASESRAAIAGGVTSYLEMPNTSPATTSVALWEDKMQLAAASSFANYAFYIGATNDNLTELKKADPHQICGIKVFMGSSTGNMLVDSEKTLSAIFAETGMLIAAHCEDQSIIEHNIEACRKQFGNDIPIEYHPMIRSAEACYRSSARAMELADRYAARLHVLHLSTERETGLLSAGKASNKKITAEVCVQYLLFSTQNMPNAALCKCNPAIKEETDRIALLKALAGNKTDTVATDHAPHLLSEKQGGALQAASGAPMVQHSLQAMLSLCSEGFISRETVVEKMCHAPADLFHIERRGYIRKGYYADMVLIDPQRQTTVDAHNILYKCGWSSLEGKSFNHSIDTVFLNGQIAFHNGEVKDRCAAMPLYFDC